MTLINWITVSIAAVMVTGFIVAKIYYNRKLKKLDGLHGLIYPDSEPDAEPDAGTDDTLDFHD